jgi:hypothetical protein
MKIHILNLVTLIAIGASFPTLAEAAAFISAFSKVDTISTTRPANQDENPYGVAVIPRDVGKLKAGNILVSNFNNSGNLQGQGSTIVQITPAGGISLFAQLDAAHLPGECPGGVGLTTALTVFRQGWVIVGSLPTTGTTAAFSGPGCLIVLDADGNAVETFHNDAINGPWDSTAVEHGDDAVLFVANVLNGGVTSAGGAVVNAGTILRLELELPDPASATFRHGGGSDVPVLRKQTLIGSGFSQKTDPNALIVGPTGLGIDEKTGILYVADTVNSRIAGIPHAFEREDTAHAGDDVTANINLNGPLGLAIAPNGDILTVNAGDGNIVETTPQGAQIATFTLVTNGAGALFGLAVTPGGSGIYFVNDNDNTLQLFH